MSHKISIPFITPFACGSLNSACVLFMKFSRQEGRNFHFSWIEANLIHIAKNFGWPTIFRPSEQPSISQAQKWHHFWGTQTHDASTKMTPIFLRSASFLSTQWVPRFSSKRSTEKKVDTSEWRICFSSLSEQSVNSAPKATLLETSSLR